MLPHKELGVEIATTDVSLVRAGSHLSLSLNGSADRLVLGDWFTEAGYRIEQIRFFNGTVWDTAAINAMLGAPAGGTAGSDTLRGTDGSDALDGLRVRIAAED